MSTTRKLTLGKLTCDDLDGGTEAAMFAKLREAGHVTCLRVNSRTNECYQGVTKGRTRMEPR